MRVIDEAYLDTVRFLRRCEHCKRAVTGCEPHHLLARGMGGGGRMDIPPNVIGLCRLCHQKFHDGNLKREDFLITIGKRLGIKPEEVLQECYRVRALPKGSDHGYEFKQDDDKESRVDGIEF